MSAAARQRRRRARQRDGLTCLRVVVDPVNLAATLIAARYLSPCVDDDNEALARAVERMLADLKAADI